MLDRVREALFSTLGSLVDEAQVLDLFAGTGSLGAEALSRGAAYARFVERDRKVGNVILRNLETLDTLECSQLRLGDALSPRQWAREEGETPWDLVFCDPPYPLLREGDGRRRVMEAVRALMHDALARDGTLVLHTEPRALSEHDFDKAWEVDKRVYGRTVLWYLTLKI